MSTTSFLSSELLPEPPNTAESAFFQLIPAPLEATVSYGGGTAKGPAAILEASDQLELWDGESVPAKLGIYTHPSIDCSTKIAATSDEQMPVALLRIRESVANVLNRGKMPVLLGGEHTVSYGALQALQAKYGRFGILQFDAHADLRNTYEDTQWSHACVMCRAVADLGLPLAQFGVRALCLEEVKTRQKYRVHFHDAAELAKISLADLTNDHFPLEKPLLPLDFPKQVYLTFDVDALDPSIMPATGTPVPGGLGWYTALALIKQTLSGRHLLGFDVVEFAPIPNFHAYDFTAARLVYAIMGMGEKNVLREF